MGRILSRRGGYAVAVVVAALAVGVLLARDAAAQRATQYGGPGPGASDRDGYGNGPGHGSSVPALPRWQYAVLRYEIVNGNWAWITPEEVKRGDKKRLFRELGGYGRPGDHDVSYVDIASQAGLYGWELTTVLEREKGTEIWFKRPVR